MIPPVVNRLISVRELRAVAIKHLVELSVEHEFFATFFSKRKTCHVHVDFDSVIFTLFTVISSAHVFSLCYFPLTDSSRFVPAD